MAILHRFYCSIKTSANIWITKLDYFLIFQSKDGKSDNTVICLWIGLKTEKKYLGVNIFHNYNNQLSNKNVQ